MGTSLHFFCLTIAIVLSSLSGSGHCQNDVNLTLNATAQASSSRGKYKARNAIDQKVDDQSRWLLSESDPRGWLQIIFPGEVNIGVVDVFSGYKDGSPVQEFDVAFKQGGKWSIPENGKVRGNQDLNCRLKISQKNVSAIKVSLRQPGAGRIREIAVYENAKTPLGSGLKLKSGTAPVDRTRHQIAVNQIGYIAKFPKRFTAPLTADGTEFQIRRANGDEIVLSGTVKNQIGDFSDLDAQGEFVIHIAGDELKASTSDPFLISDNIINEYYWQGAIDFLIDSRAVVGTHPSAYGGCPWRDGTYYDAIIPSLVLFYLADPELNESLDRQMDWNAEKRRVTAKGFKFDKRNPCSEGVMDAVGGYYQMDPPKEDAPDVVKLIHWGAGYYVNIPATKDPSGDPLGRKIHSQTLEQLSYVLWAWPKLKKWLPQDLYDRCLELCLQNWASSGALEVPKQWSMATYQQDVGGKKRNPMGGKLHPYKGRHAPGHSIVPNLLMYEVALRDDLKNPERFLDAAKKQASWVVANIDWKDPRTTKGHRMSEHRTITNLVWFLQKYPRQAPRGLKKKISDWIDVAISRSNNMWDFRRYDMKDHWTIPKLNDVGNSIALPAILLSASWMIDDESKQSRLQELAAASIDHVFGRNPRLAAAPSQPEKGFTGVERGWPRAHPHNVCARLETVRSSISATPGSEMYPFNPEGRYRHAEGWVNYGACWCLTLAYLKFDEEKQTPDLN